MDRRLPGRPLHRPAGARLAGLAAPAGQDPEDEEVGYLQYTPLAHPDVPTAPGTMLVSVSRNVTDYQMLLETPQLGRPLFAEVPRP